MSTMRPSGSMVEAAEIGGGGNRARVRVDGKSDGARLPLPGLDSPPKSLSPRLDPTYDAAIGHPVERKRSEVLIPLTSLVSFRGRE